MCGKRCQNIFIGLKKRLVWVFEIRGERENDNETGLKEGGGLEISIYSAFHSTLSFALIYLPNIFNKCISASSGPITFAM